MIIFIEKILVKLTVITNWIDSNYRKNIVVKVIIILAVIFAHNCSLLYHKVPITTATKPFHPVCSQHDFEQRDIYDTIPAGKR